MEVELDNSCYLNTDDIMVKVHAQCEEIPMAKQAIAQKLHKYYELLNFKLVTDPEITTYCKLLEAKRAGGAEIGIPYEDH
ncbi:hypothetical protein I79_015957 [Cricetulus griseus]|uniref:Uncharacterized protein n=1 Tax=Cricetulus griseus TaxID=10029 RepID=G3HY40_CRIGR|nr:hypothetical protein I79_015957 [Cricetulus griseus]